MLMLTSSSCRFAISLVLLLTCNAQLTNAFFAPSNTLQQLVHHWLHWGANLHSSNQANPAHHPRAPNALNPSSLSPQLPSYIIGAADANISLSNSIQYSLTMMHRPEIDLVVSYLRSNHVYLEFGAGGSTVNFPPLVARAYSVEHNCEWANFLSEKLHAHGQKYANLHIKCVSVKPRDNAWGTISNYEHANYKQFRQYVDTVDTLPEETIDRVFIDGRARLACALKVLPLLKNDSLVFIHDFYSRTKHYGPVLRYYTEVARVLASRNSDPAQGPIDEPQGIVVLRRKPNVNYDLSANDIDKIYDTIDWRFPFGPPLTSITAYLRYYVGLATDPGQWARGRNPDDLIHLLHRDLLRMAVFYIIFIIIVKNRNMLIRSRPSARRDRTLSERVPTRSASEPPNSEVRFMETEGMRAANARRKRTNSTNRAN